MISHNLNRQRLRRQMHAISAGRPSDIRSIVGRAIVSAAARDLRRTRNQIVKHSRVQRLLANLKQGNFCVYSSAN
jgi:hypothetical protein